MRVALLTTDSRECFRDYAAGRPYYGTAVTALLQGLATLPELEVHVLSCTQRRLAPEDQLASNILSHTLYVSKFGWLRTGYQGCIRAMRRKLKKIQPDIVHGQGTERDSAISAVFSGYPNLITVHGNMRKIAKIHRAKPPSHLWCAARLETFTLPRTGGIICITDYTRSAVRELLNKTWIVPNAVDKCFFEIERAPQSLPLILCVGDISLHKNQNAFIRSLDDLAGQRSFFVLFLGQIGSSAYGAEFRHLVENRAWCEYRGFADRETLKDCFRRAHLLVLPSLEENCPMVVLEAMASGLPVVAARVGGVPELIEDGQTGLLCDPNNSANIRAVVSKILDDPDLAGRISHRAREVAHQRFHSVVVARRHAEIYQEVIG